LDPPRVELQNFPSIIRSIADMDRVIKWLLLLAGAVAMLPGCATGIARLDGETSVDRYRPYLGDPIDHFTAFSFDGWEFGGGNQVVVWTGVNEAYLITVWNSCRDLDFAQHIGVTSTGNSVSRMEVVRVGRQRCPIEEIRPIDIRGYKADRAAQREGEALQSRRKEET
jgi:hypothetical protein